MALIDRLTNIEEKLIKEESVLVGIRFEVREALIVANQLWDKQVSEAMNAQTEERLNKKKFSLVHRCKSVW